MRDTPSDACLAAWICEGLWCPYCDRALDPAEVVGSMHLYGTVYFVDPTGKTSDLQQRVVHLACTFLGRVWAS